MIAKFASLYGLNNQYEQALLNVGNVVEPYDLDKSFPVFGFGGIPRHIPGISSVSHCFAMNGQPQNPKIFGIQGIVDTYRSTLTQIGLSGPTYFAPLLRDFRKYVYRKANQYNISLLLTDGEIHDMTQTKELIDKLSYDPRSIIIFGVGNYDFEGMQELDELDGDGGNFKQFTDGNQTASHDIVQFVAYNEAV